MIANSIYLKHSLLVMKKIICLLLFIPCLVFSQSTAEKSVIIQRSNTKSLNESAERYSKEFNQNKQLAQQLSKIYGWPKIKNKNGSYSELIGVTPNNRPIYYMTYNEGAGITTRANKLYTGGGLGLNIQGENMLSSVWDAGSSLTTHELFSGRLQSLDNSPFTHPHATHVAGTIIGSDLFQSGRARGMAFKGNVNCYDWNNDVSEVANAAANGLLLSNHSYGYSPFEMQDFQWGKYDSKSRAFDDIMFNAPYYQFVCAAGNSRGSFNTTKNGYDLITGHGLSKNGITVAAVQEVLNYTGPNAVVISETSSWGPTDDGRIKPDIAAKGVNTFSATDASNSSYGYLSGTSMAAPSVNGTLLLLQQYYNQLNGSYMKAATLKGLMIHTADEAGSNPGPDYTFGWGLINAERSANLITRKGLESYILENTLSQNNSFTLEVNALGSEPLVVTLSWTDPQGEIHSFNVDDATPALVNDLDVRVTKSDTTYYPWKLNPANPGSPGTTGDNIVDNVEKTEINNPTGSYTVSVSHKGNLQNGSQNYSLLISGITLKNFWFTTLENSKSLCNTSDETTYSFAMNTKTDFNEPISFSAVNLPLGVSAVFSPVTMNAPGNFSVTLGNLTNLIPGEYPIIIRGQSDSDVFETTIHLTILSSNFIPITLQQPLDGALSVVNPVLFNWQTDVNAQNYEIQVAADSDFTVIVESASITTNSYRSSALNNDRQYFWRVRNTNSCGVGSYSNGNTFTTACTAPTNIALVNVTKTTATIGWYDNASNWTVEIVPQGNIPSGNGTVVITNPTVFTNLIPNTCYDFYLLAECSTAPATLLPPFSFCTTPDYCAGDHFYDSGGPNSNYADAEDRTIVIYPDSVGQRVRTVFNNFQLDNCCDYMVVFNGPNDTYPFLTFANGNNSPGTIASTDSSGALTFVFHSNSNSNFSGWDATVICELLPACPNAPDGFNLINATTTSATIGWNDRANSTAWEAELVPHNAAPSGIATTNFTTNPFQFTGLLSNTCYDFYLRSVCVKGTSDWAGPFTFCTEANYCGGDHFYDSGGINDNYQNYEYKISVISPNIAGKRVRAVFNNFEIDSCCDTFMVFNGPDQNAPLLYNSENNPNPPATLVSTDISGALTVVFSSDGFNNNIGWDATIICESLPPCASTPSEIAVVTLNTTSAQIGWQENSNSTSWEIELLPQGNLPTGAGMAVNTNAYLFEGLTSNSCYDFYVRSICGSGGASGWSMPFRFCTQANFCAGDHFYDSGGASGNYQNDEYKITVITPDAPGERIRAVFNNFNLENCCDRFKVYNGPDTSYPLLYTNTSNPNPPATLVSTDNSGALTFKFISNEQNTQGGWDATISCETLPPCANLPSAMTAINLSTTSATIGWQENSNATSWEVAITLQNTTPTGSGSLTNSNSKFFSSLLPSTCYDFYVRAICGTVPSEWTQAYTFCTEPEYCGGAHFYDSGGVAGNYPDGENKTTIIYPSQPGNRVRAIFNAYQLESCCDYLRIYNGPDTTFPLLYNDASVSPGSVASTAVSGALTFEFHADGNVNASGWDAVIICEPMPVCPEPPTQLTVQSVTTTTALLSWTDNTNANSWNVEILPKGNLPTGVGTEINNATYQCTNLQTDTCYDFYVQSLCPQGTTGWSGPIAFCTAPDYCGGDHFYDSGGLNGNYFNNENKTTIIFPANAADKVSAIFNSFNLEGCCDYLRIYNGPNATYALLYSGGYDSPGTVISTDSSGALTFEFHSDGSANTSGWDATIDCSNLSVSSVADSLDTVEYYPNPVNQMLTIDAHQKVKKYTIYTIEGKQIREAKINTEKFEIDMQNWRSGSYILKLTDEHRKTKTLKIIKN